MLRRKDISVHPSWSESFLPDFCTLPNTFVLVVSSLLLAFVLALANFSHDQDFWSELGLHAWFIIWVALLSGMMLCLLRDKLDRLDGYRSGFAAFLVVQAVTVLVAVFVQAGLSQFGYGVPAGQEPLAFYLRILAVSGLITAAWLRYLYIQSRWRLQIKAEAMARLEALQARMQPHFLFNSLNTIASLVRENPVTAEELLLDLAEVLRAILKKEAKTVALAEEVRLTCQYLNIEQQRLGARLEVAWDLEQAPLDAAIPPLSLQPLVENAIRHGVECSEQGGTVHIHGRLTSKGLVLTIRNTLPGADARPSRPGTREALANLRARLEACFPSQARLYTGAVDGCYKSRIVIPYLPCPKP